MSLTANFSSDNVTGAAPEILEALVRANAGDETSYGEDQYSKRVTGRLSEVFETEVAVFPVATGSAANVLSLSVIAPSFGAVYCHAESHINTDECNAPEFYTAGAKLVPLEGEHGRLTPDTVAGAIAGAGVVHHAQPAALSLSQATESGTVYTPEALSAMAEICRAQGLSLHIDGARFANALVYQDVSPAALTWQAGVDVLSFGATKNGALAAEAVVLFGDLRDKAEELGYRRKRGGHLFSKGRVLGAQLEAYLADDLWLRNARQANATAARLAEGLTALPGASLRDPVEANEIFARLPAAVIEGLRAEGFKFYSWGPEDDPVVRLVTAWCTMEAEVDAFLAAARRHAEATAAA